MNLKMKSLLRGVGRRLALAGWVVACVVALVIPANTRAALVPVRDDCRNGEFQFSARFNNGGVDGKPAVDFTAYLWIPPACKQVRGVVFTQENVGEQPFTNSPSIRTACANSDLAIVWCCLAFDIRFENNREAAVKLQEHVLEELARVSGYSELARAPWITFGHSTTVTYARNCAEARPDRTIAVIYAKGGVAFPPVGSYAGPMLITAGQYPEWRQPTHDWTTHGHVLEGLKRLRAAQAEQFRPLSYIEPYGGGHFDYPPAYLDFLAFYIEKAVHYRLAPDGAVRSLDLAAGYVVDMRPPLPLPPLTVMAAAKATGELRTAPWFFDRETAEAAAAFMGAEDWSRQDQIVAFANLDGTPAAFSKSGIADPVPIEMAADGVTIKRMATTFIEQLPVNFTQAGMKFTHATTRASTVENISGVFSVENGGYRIRLNRGYPETPNFIAVRHPGDATHRPSVQPGRFVVPEYHGRAQTIAFTAPADQVAANKEARAIDLHATSSAGLKVEFYVKAGPARIDGDRLVLLPLPPRAKLPVPVEVVAWQLGHDGTEAVSAAPTVEKTFYVGGK